MTWLVTGGAGYIGAHVVRAFADAGLPVVVLDDLSSRHREFVPDDVPFVEGSDPRHRRWSRATLREHDVDGVVHVAGFKYAGVSVSGRCTPTEQNVTGTVSVLLEAIAERRHRRVLFSSSAADVRHPRRRRSSPRRPRRAPESPVRRVQAHRRVAAARPARATAGLRHTSLRYFNVVGSGADRVYDTSPHNLFPLVFEALVAGRSPAINGDDYPTPDGTCVRDYIHVADLAVAHVRRGRGARLAGAPLEPVYNLGSGDGLVGAADHGRHAPRHRHRLHARGRAAPRPATPPASSARSTLAAPTSGGRSHSLDEMVESAWRAWRRQLELYGGAPPSGGRLLSAGTV